MFMPLSNMQPDPLEEEHIPAALCWLRSSLSGFCSEDESQQVTQSKQDSFTKEVSPLC